MTSTVLVENNAERAGTPAAIPVPRPVGAGGPAKRWSTWQMTRDALLVGMSLEDGMISRVRGHDISRFRAGGRRFVVLTKPEYIDHVLHTARLNYIKSVEFEPIRLAAGLNLLTDEGDSWAEHRAAINPMFARRYLNDIVDLMIDPIEEMTSELAGRAGRIEVDLHEVMVQMTLRVVANALFSQDFGGVVASMSDMATKGLRITEVINRFSTVGLLNRSGWGLIKKSIYSRVPLPPPFSTMQKIAHDLDDAVNAVVDDRIAHPTDSPDLLNILLSADEGSWPRQRVRDEALTFMLAGHETTANAMSWFWYLMALNPEARQRMHAEIDEVLGGRRPGVDDLAQLPWTTACVQESQRYYSAVWSFTREAVADDVIDGHHIRRGTTVIVPSHYLHHDPRYWSDPEQFDPTRFLPGAPRPQRSTYLPFGGGRRVCIGQSFALMEMVLIVAVLSGEFTFDLVPGHPVEPEATVTLRPRHGLRVVARRRQEER
ncbi:MAG: cytochrome P450 [Propionibacteriales bacterium]|nr:cytochrome P450 [Propionibacteriales bacterium]